MEDSSNNHALKDGNAEDEQSGQWNNSTSEGCVSPQRTDRPQPSSEDTATKTIEFLRARLLAERATSKAAKESAEQNAKRLIELERLLEIETEQRRKAEAAMQEVMEKLRNEQLSSASDHVSPEKTLTEKQRITEDREDLEDGCGSNSTCIAKTEEEKITKDDLNNNILQEDGQSSANSVQSKFVEQSKEESNGFTIENTKSEDYDQNSGFIHGQMSNQSETKDNAIALSSPSQDQMPTQSAIKESKDNCIVLSSPLLENLCIQDQVPNQNEIKDNGFSFICPSVQNQAIQDQVSNQRECKDNCIVLSSPSLQNPGIQDQMPNQSEIKENGIVLSSPSSQNQIDHDQMTKQSGIKDNWIVLSSQSSNNQGEYDASTDHGMPLCEDVHNENDDVSEGRPETFTDRSITMNSRLKIEEKITELIHQKDNEVAPLAGQDQKEFLRLRLHELVDQFVCMSEKEIHKYENCTLQTANCASQLPTLERTCLQKTSTDRISRHNDLQPEVPCKGLNRVDSSETDKSFDSSSDFKNQNEREASPSIESIVCKRQENEYKHAILCCGTRGDICKCQNLDFSDTFLPVKEELCSHKHFQNFNDCCKEIHFTTQSFVGTTTSHSSLYHNHENTMCRGRSYNHNLVGGGMELGNPLELSRVSESDGCMHRHHDLNGSHSTSYLMKSQSPASRFYQGTDILPSRAGPSPVRNCHNYLPSQLANKYNHMPDSKKNAAHTQLYLEYSSPLQWSSRGTPVADAELPRLPGSKVGDALMALRHAKKQIQRSIETRKNSPSYTSFPSQNRQNPCRQLVPR